MDKFVQVTVGVQYNAKEHGWMESIIALDDKGELYRLAGSCDIAKEEWEKLPPHPTNKEKINE